MSPTSADPMREILNRLGDSVKPAGAGKWSARCPAHDDRRASLSITTGDDGRALLHCHAGCKFEAITSALNLRPCETFQPKEHNGNGHREPLGPIIETYDYVDAEGNLRHQTTRHSPKDFRQRRPDGKGGWINKLGGIETILYRLGDLLNENEDGSDEWRFIVEGEKDADRLASEGLISTCNPMGAGKWQDRYSEIFRGKRCCIIADKDQPGRTHAQQVAKSLESHGAADVRIIECPGDGVKDASDFIGAGGTADQLLEIVESTPAWKPIAPTSNDRATELANAEELHRRHGPRIRYHKDRREFYINAGTHWQRDLFGQVNQWAKEVARKSTDRLAEIIEGRELSRFAKQVESARGISGVLKLLESETGIPATADDFDRNDYLLNVANGTLELAVNPKLRPHDPRDMITHCLSTPYDPSAKCQLWESVVNRAMAANRELVGYLQRWAGSFLTGAANIHELLICYGVGANSKSVIFDTLCRLLESLAGVAPESLLTARSGKSEHPTEIMDLMGKRLVVASETESGATLRLQLLKRLTGDSVLKGRYVKCNFVEFRRTHKMVLITNNKPRLTENTEAVWRRLRLLPFNVVIPPEERDPNLLEKLKAENAGILAWCVRGCAEMLRDGMNPPDEVLVATKEYRDESDELQPFIESHCIAGDAETFRVSRADLFTAYTAWAKASNERHSLDRASFYEQIRRREGIVDDQWKVDGKPVRGFRGLGLMAKTDER